MKPRVSLIVAKTKSGVIGMNGKMPWHLSEDLKFFKQATMGKPIIMGRKTWESIGRPLPGRRNVVISHNPAYQAAGAEVVGSFLEALKLFDSHTEVMVIGGASIYREALPYVDTAWITEIDADFEGDAFFEDLNPQEWKRVWVEEHKPKESRPWGYRFQRFVRIGSITY